MRPIILDCDSADVPNLFDYKPVNPEDFGFPLNLIIGTEGDRGADNFQLMVATPRYIQKMYPRQSAVLLRHFLIVFQYDFNEILDVINRYVGSIEEDTWEKIAAKISQIALWEFEDYRPYQPPES